MVDQRIDFVLPWVDGEDLNWLAEKASYSPSYLEDNREIRYRNWDNLHFWFRSVEKFAPWVNKIHFITWGHLPEWLKLDHPKLNIVRHEDYIPEEFLPTFSSHTIELNLHRIEGLSEEFVYFNDDIFLLSRVEKEDFFKNGLPVDSAILNAITPRQGQFSPILVQSVSVINKYFKKAEVLKKDPYKWLNLKYGKPLIRTLCLLPWTHFTGFYNHHLALAYRKETFEEVWQREEELLLRTCSNKFRNDGDVNQYIFRYWRLAKGEFIPGTPLGSYINLEEGSEKILKLMNKPKQKMICINDSQFQGDFEEETKRINEAFLKLFPEKSSFEI